VPENQGARRSGVLARDCVRERNGVWHACRGRGNADWQPIKCSKNEGIVLPGPRVEREPTCADCLAALGAD